MLLRERIEAHLELDACRRGEWKSGSNADREVPLIEIAITEWCNSEVACERFVNAEIGGPAWTSLDALARIYEFQACVWHVQRGGYKRQVYWVGQSPRMGREAMHMLHNGRNHFDRLVLVL